MCGRLFPILRPGCDHRNRQQMERSSDLQTHIHQVFVEGTLPPAQSLPPELGFPQRSREGQRHPESQGEGSQQGYGLGKLKSCPLLPKTSTHTLQRVGAKDSHSALPRKGLKNLDTLVMKNRQRQLTRTFTGSDQITRSPCDFQWKTGLGVVDGTWVGIRGWRTVKLKWVD